MLQLKPAGADTQDDTPVRDMIDRDGHLHVQAGIAKGIGQHVMAESYALGGLRPGGAQGGMDELG